MVRRRMPGPFGKGRARRRNLALDGRLNRVEDPEGEHLLEPERGLGRLQAADLDKDEDRKRDGQAQDCAGHDDKRERARRRARPKL